MNEIISETKLAGKYRRRGTSVASASSVVNLTDQGPRITDQKFETQFGTSDDLLIDHCSLDIERRACQGMTLDPVTGLYYARNRNYDPSLGSVLRQEPKSRLSAGAAHREINQDPAGYINGANTYQFVMSNPVGNVDPNGLSGAGAALGQYLYWQSATDQLVNQFQHYQGQPLGLLKGIAAASELGALKAENQFHNLKHESPLQSLANLRDRLEKAAKIGKHAPYAKPLADVLERLGVFISVVKAERGLASTTGPGQLKGLGNALLALGALMGLGIGPWVSSAGQYLANAANAVNYIDRLGGGQNFNAWVNPSYNAGILNDDPDVPFSPQWAKTVLSENGQGLPSFSQAYQNFENNGQGYYYH